MKKIILFVVASLIFSLTGCEKYLGELKPLDKTSVENLTATPDGFKAMLANLYYNMPMEDFNYRFTHAFNYRGWGPSGYGVQALSAMEMFTDNAGRSSGTGIGVNNGASYWPYTNIRSINSFMENAEAAYKAGILSEEEYHQYLGEAYFIRAYTYFGLVKRVGGVPLVKETLDKYYDVDDNKGLYIPRSTEEESWDFILDDCDKAAENLSETAPDKFRANRYVAYALKSRVALFAASLATNWGKAPLTASSEAVSKHLVGGFSADAARRWYGECISASEAIFKSNKYELLNPNPKDAEEAVKTYISLFQNIENKEYIFGKGYAGESLDSSHGYDVFYSPHQAATGYTTDTRYNIMVNLVDVYEDLDSDGKSAPLKTRTDGNETVVLGAQPTLAQIKSLPLMKYDNPQDIFANKDPRFKATVLYPGSEFRGKKIVIQAGAFNADELQLFTNKQVKGADGKDYWSLGAAVSSDYSGFEAVGGLDDANFTSSGFTLRKFLVDGPAPAGIEMGSSTTPWIDFRLAEIYLNYAEAVVVSGQGNAANAAKYLNDIRHRAFLPGDVPLTLENVKKERRVELALENHRMWDLVRWREFHTLFSNHDKRTALLPLEDLTGPTPKYVFVRAEWFLDSKNNGYTFEANQYYKAIPNTQKNGLIPNNF